MEGNSQGRTKPGCPEWTDREIKLFVETGEPPEFWRPNSPVTYGLLRKLVQNLESEGKILKYSLPPLLMKLKPSYTTEDIPRISTINEQLKRKKNLAHPDNEVPWLSQQTISLGTYCESFDIKMDNLDSGRSVTVPRQFPNGVILELQRHMNRRRLPWKKLSDWLFNLGFGESPTSPRKLQYQVQKVRQAEEKASKRPEVQSLLSSDFCIPETPSQEYKQIQLQKTQIKQLQKRNELLEGRDAQLNAQKQMANAEKRATTQALRSLQLKTDSVGTALFEEQQKTATLTARLSESEADLQQSSADLKRCNPTNIRRRERHYLKTITEQRQQISELQKQNETITSQRDKLKERLSKANERKHGAQKIVSHLKRKTSDLKERLDRQEVDIYTASKQQKIAESNLVEANAELEDLLTEKYNIPTMEDGKFTTDVRCAAMKLHSYGVGTANIAKCMSAVGKDIFHTELTPLPSETTMRRLVMEANIVGKLHVGETLMKSSDNTLHLDGTTDHQRHFIGFQASLPSGSLSLAMVETATEDTTMHVDMFKQIMADYGSILSTPNNLPNDIMDNLVLSLKNTMTDQHVVNKAFKEQLEQLREGILQRSVEGWEELCTEDQQKMIRVNQWFCLLHILLGIAEALLVAIKEYEDIVTRNGELRLGRKKPTQDNTTRETSVCVEMIKTACSLLSTKGHPAAGLPMDFKSFLETLNSPFHFKPFKHNRFNIIPHNAVAVIFHLDHIHKFLALTHHENQLITALKEDIEDVRLIAMCRGIAIFHKYITAPLHRIILQQNIAPHILDMNQHLRSVQSALETLSVNPAAVLQPGFQLDDEMPPMEEGMFQSLERPVSEMELTLEVLGIVSTASLVTFTRQISHQLPTGNVGVDSADLRTEARSVPKSNSIGESQFALLKYLRGFKPHATVQHLETGILWAFNKTGDWLDTQSQEEKSRLFLAARNKTREFRMQWKTRNAEVGKKRMEVMLQKQSQRSQKSTREASAQQKSLDTIWKAGGQCKTEDDVNKMLAACTTAQEKQEALKSQLQFYKNVIKPPVHRSYYFMTQAGKKLSNDRLMENLKKVIQVHVFSLDPQNTTETPAMPGPSQRQLQLEQAKKAMLSTYDRNMTAADSCRGVKRKQPMPDIVGKTVRHRWKVGKRHKWYLGKVIGFSDPDKAPSFPEDTTADHLVKYQLFDIKYDGDDGIYAVALDI